MLRRHHQNLSVITNSKAICSKQKLILPQVPKTFPAALVDCHIKKFVDAQTREGIENNIAFAVFRL